MTRKKTEDNGQPKLPKYAVTALSDLIPYINNSRTHSEAQVDQIAASMREFGWLAPIVIDGDRGILAGHGRVMAAKKLGWAVAPTIDAGHLTPTQRKAYIIADNKLAENAGWDKDMLKLEIETLQEADFNLELLGFSIDELEAMHELGATSSLNAGGDAGSSGADVAALKWNKQRVELTTEEAKRLDDALEQYLDAYGNSSGFASWLIQGNANA